METLDAKEADALRKAWGDKPCAHPWWVEETLDGADLGKVACKTCGLDRRKGTPVPDSRKGKTTAGSDKGKTKTDSATATAPTQKVADPDMKATAPTQKVADPDLKATAPTQKVEEVDLTATIQKVTDPNWKAPASNPQVKDLDSAADGVVAMLTPDFALTLLDEAKIVSVIDRLRDALVQWRERQQKKKRST